MDLVRLAPMLGVVVVHVLLYGVNAGNGVGGGAVLMLLHVNRELFFFVTALVLAYSTRGGERRFEIVAFWRHRYWLVLPPYLAWNVIYWFVTGSPPWIDFQALRQLAQDLATGWSHLYFLLVTMQFYAVFPGLAWLIRRTRYHWLLLGGAAVFQLALLAVLRHPAGLPGPVAGYLNWSQDEATSYVLWFVAGALVGTHLEACLGWLRTHCRSAALAALAALAAGEGWYARNLFAGQSPATASSVFQPVVVLLVPAALVVLFGVAEQLHRAVPEQGRLWRAVAVGADLSFGFFLVHMLVLMGVNRAPLGLDQLPGALGAAVMVALVTVGSVLAAALLRRTPFSHVLTGRPRRRASVIA